MLDKLFGFRIHNTLHLVGFFLLCFGVPINKVVMSIGTIWCIANLLLEADFKTYYENLKKNRLFILFFGVNIMLFIALLWTNNLEYAFHDIRVKLPLFVIPLVYVAKPIQLKDIHYGFLFFCLSLLITSIINFYNYATDFNNGMIKDVREMSHFGSHIRYSLFVAFGAGIALLKTIKRDKYYIIWAVLFAWFSFYMLKSQIFGGLIAYGFMLGGLFLYSLYKLKSSAIKMVLLATVILIVGFGSFKLYSFLKPDSISPENLELTAFSKEGNPYKHDLSVPIFENGRYVLTFISEKELRRDWPKRSELHLDSLDAKNQKVLFTLLRYLTSKDLHKDAAGLAKLSDEEIKYIEQGIPSVQYLETGVMERLYGLKFEIQQYKNEADPTGHSLLQRFEHWRAGTAIIKENWLIGVGTGDVQDAFNKKYNELNSKLDKKHRKRAHNQFLTFWISFGIVGFLFFILFWFLFIKKIIKTKNSFALAFALIAIASFLPEDTLETQQGVTFIALFTAIFLGELKQRVKST